MGTLIILIIMGLVIIWVYKKHKKHEKYKKYSTQKTIDLKPQASKPQITASIHTRPSTSFENPDTGDITPTQDGGWVLNPKSTFPLTIYGANQTIASELKALLDAGYSLGSYAHARTIISIIARFNLRCKEIEDYIKKFKPLYFTKIEELKKSSTEWALASDRDKEDLLAGFRKQAIESLDIRPYCDLETLFECEPADVTIDDAVIDQFGYENLLLYLRYANNLDRVFVIPADHFDRSGFEKLVELGLARRGADISLPAILETLKLKDMNELVADLKQKPFSRKAKAIEFLMNLPDIRERIGKVIAFRELFQLKPLPDEFSNIDLNRISSAWRYTNEIATLITHTYVMGAYSSRDMHQDDVDSTFIKGWEILPAGDDATCPYCKRAASGKYPKKQRPKVPLHIGCRCTVLARID